MNTEDLVSKEREEAIYREHNKAHRDAGAGPLSHWDFGVGFHAALEELGVTRVVEFTRDRYSSECPFLCECCYCNLKDGESKPQHDGLSLTACPGLIGKPCDEIVDGAVLVRTKNTLPKGA